MFSDFLNEERCMQRMLKNTTFAIQWRNMCEHILQVLDVCRQFKHCASTQQDQRTLAQSVHYSHYVLVRKEREKENWYKFHDQRIAIIMHVLKPKFKTVAHCCCLINATQKGKVQGQEVISINVWANIMNAKTTEKL